MKKIYILLIIIFILFVILGMKICNSNKKPEYSLRDIQLILRKADNLTNYECKIDYGEFTYYKKKNNKIFLESATGAMLYRDYNENVEIYMNNNYEKYYVERKIKSEKIPSSNLYTSTVDVDEVLYFSKVLNAKEEKYNRITCLKVELALEETEKEVVVLWINVENGLIMKIKFPDATIKEYEYKFNTVTDEDVNPDLTGYTKLEADI